MTSKRWFAIHSFTGVFGGLMLFILCWSGTFAVVSHELDWLANRNLQVTPHTTPTDWQQLYTAVQSAHPAGAVRWLDAPKYKNFAATVVVDLPHQNSVRVLVNSATGEITGSSSYFTIQRFFRSFHMSFFDVAGIGYWIVYIFSLVFFTSIVSALVFFRKWWRQFFRFKWETGPKLWSELHRFSGVWSLWFSIIIAVTGIWYLIEASRAEIDGVYAYAGDAEYSLNAIPGPQSDKQLPFLSLNELVAKTAKVRPDIAVSQISLNVEEGIVTIMGRAGNPLIRDRANHLVFDWRTAEILYHQKASELPVYWIISHLADPLHFGDFGSFTLKLVWVFFSIALCLIILSGTWLYANKTLRRSADIRNKLSVFVGIGFTLVILFASCVAGWREILHYGPVVNDVQQLPDVTSAVFTILSSWTVLTVAIIGLWCALLLKPGILLSHRSQTCLPVNKAVNSNNGCTTKR